MLATSAVSKGFRLGDHYPGVYLSNTELRIMIALLRGKQRAQIACELGLALRTVDYYCFNMMRLLGFVDLEGMVDALRHNPYFADIC